MLEYSISAVFRSRVFGESFRLKGVRLRPCRLELCGRKREQGAEEDAPASSTLGLPKKEGWRDPLLCQLLYMPKRTSPNSHKNP